MSDLIYYNGEALTKAFNFAAEAHKGQTRKYTGEPYISHPYAVARMILEIDGDENMVIAALLHDTVEDTPVTLEQISFIFGEDVAMLVEFLTDVSHADDGVRVHRKEIDRQHTAKACSRAKTIKLADLIHNTQSIVEHGKGFAKIYLAEKRLLLEVLQEGDAGLYARAMAVLEDGERRVGLR